MIQISISMLNTWLAILFYVIAMLIWTGPCTPRFFIKGFGLSAFATLWVFALQAMFRVLITLAMSA